MYMLQRFRPPRCLNRHECAGHRYSYARLPSLPCTSSTLDFHLEPCGETNLAWNENGPFCHMTNGTAVRRWEQLKVRMPEDRERIMQRHLHARKSRCRGPKRNLRSTLSFPATCIHDDLFIQLRTIFPCSTFIRDVPPPYLRCSWKHVTPAWRTLGTCWISTIIPSLRSFVNNIQQPASSCTAVSKSVLDPRTRA